MRGELPKCRLEDEMFISDNMHPCGSQWTLWQNEMRKGPSLRQFVVQERDDTKLSGHFSSFFPYRRITLFCNLGSLFYLRHTKEVATSVCWQKQVQARNRTLRTVQSLEKSSVVAFYFPLWPSVWAKLLKEKRFVWLRVWGNTVYPSREGIAAGGLVHDAHCQETE